MANTTNNASPAAPGSGFEDHTAARVFRTMTLAVTAAVLVSAVLAPWRTTTGLLVGGVLSLLNFHWMRNSISAVLAAAGDGQRGHWRASQYILRYFVIAGVAYGFYWLRITSLTATIVGLCSFVVAFLVEAVRQVWLSLIHREEPT
jgi:uncharacterized membrane protein